MFTQPLMYQKIKKMTSSCKQYEAQLIKEGVIDENGIKEMKKDITNELEKAYDKSKSHQFLIEDWQTPEWEAMRVSEKYGKMKDTGVNINHLKDLGKRINTLPEDIKFHP